MDISTEFTNIKRMLRVYYAQLHLKILDNPGEMDEFLEILPPKLNHEKIENLIRFKKLRKLNHESRNSNKDSHVPYGFTVEFYQP